jgi:hypothetical protein
MAMAEERGYTEIVNALSATAGAQSPEP